MTRWLETDSLSNQNIASGLAIGAYTADADRLILCQFFADQVAGNGDYDFWLTHQIAGSGSSYRYVPKTTATVASGVTAIAGQSIMVAVRSGDVLTAYLDGLAGDTTTPDTTVRWFELAALRPATADRTLAVDASGLVDLVDAPNATAVAAIQSGLATPTNITAGTITTVTTVGALGVQAKADVNAEVDAAISDAGLAQPGDQMALVDDAIKASKFDETTAFPLAAADSGSTTVFRTGADGDTGESLSDQIDSVPAAVDTELSASHGSGAWAASGSGTVTWTYALTSSVDDTPIADADVWVTTDAGGSNVIASGQTDQNGEVVFELDPGTVYVWRQKSGWNFSNPDTKVVV